MAILKNTGIKPVFLDGPPVLDEPSTLAPDNPAANTVAVDKLLAHAYESQKPKAPDKVAVLQRLDSDQVEMQFLRLLVEDPNVMVNIPLMPKIVWFTDNGRQRVFLAWKKLYEQQLTVTREAVWRNLVHDAKPAEFAILEDIFANVVYNTEIKDSADNLVIALREAAQCRRFSSMLNVLNQGFHKNVDIDDLWHTAALELAQAEDHESFVPYQEQMDLTLMQILKPDPAKMGMYTRLTQIDTMCGGIAPTQMYVAAGMQGSGKTALYLELIQRLLIRYADCAILVLTLEMEQQRLQRRQLANLAYVSVRRMEDHAKEGNTQLTADEAGRLMEARERIREWDDRVEMHFQEMGSAEVNDIARKFAFRHRGKKLICIMDHLGLYSHKNRGESAIRQGIVEGTKVMKNLQTNLGYATIPLAQMVKELENKHKYGATYHKPDQSLIAESGFINQTADVIFCLWRPEMYAPRIMLDKEPNWETKNKMLIVTGKNRDGVPGCDLVMGCNMEFMQIYNEAETTMYKNGFNANLVRPK